MIKTMILIKRKEGVSPEVFSDYWSSHHSSIVGRLPGLVRHVQNHALPGRDGRWPAYDGVAESWIRDADALADLLASDAYQEMLDDEHNFIDREATVLIPVREVETELLAADPGSTDPGSTDPGSTDPGSTDPGSTDPGSTDPTGSGPVSTDR